MEFAQKLTQSTLARVSDIVHRSDRAAPKAPDGRYDDGNGNHSRIYEGLNAVEVAFKNGIPKYTDSTVKGILEVIDKNPSFDDRTRVFNESLDFLSHMDPGSKIQTDVNNQAITMLWNTLAHPPATFLGHQFRNADGSGNSLQNPDMGKSGTTYARSVQSNHIQPMNSLPDPGLVFDTLLKARDFQEHPGRNSALTFAYAAIVTHSLFRTDSKDYTINNATSYLDLSPLYGNNQLEQDLVRDKASGRGYLHPDTFSEDRILFLPPASSVLLVLFSRNHNYIADRLLQINERGTWKNPPPTSEKEREKQDEEIFQTARLVNGGHFMSMIFGDYVAGFLGTTRNGNPWTLEAFDDIKQGDGSFLPRGTGNHVSVEFNLLYRWHATVAAKDIEWTNDEFNRLFDGKNLGEATLNDFKGAALKMREMTAAKPSERTFGGLKRDEHGRFSDDDLAKICHDATEKCAGAYRARGIPESFRVLEIMSMVQSRTWGCCTMNEFRTFLGLKTFKTFEEWNPDQEIADAARKLYGHIDNLELYPGLQAEQTIPLGPGSGICCGYTMTRALLGDAISLVRGDRYYSTDYTPRNLTTWGFQDAARDPNNGAFGAALPKLLLRHLPRHYRANSAYALFPFFIPSEAEKNCKVLNISDQYDFQRPTATAEPKVLNTMEGIKAVLDDSKKFKANNAADIGLLTNNQGFFSVFDEKTRHEEDKKLILEALFPSEDSMPSYAKWYKEKTAKLIKKHSITYDGTPGNYVDIIQNVINLTSVHWACEKLCGIPLKDDEPHAEFTEEEVADRLADLFSCAFEDTEPENGWRLQTKGKQAAQDLRRFIKQGLCDQSLKRSSFNPVTIISNRVSRFITPTATKECRTFLGRLARSGRPTEELVANVLGLAIQSSVGVSKAAAQVVDFYMSDDRQAERTAITQLASKNDEASGELLSGYIREALRLNPDFAGIYRTVVEDAVIDQGPGLPEITVKEGDVLYASIRNALLNPVKFPEPEKIIPTRPKEDYQLQGAGFHRCLGVSFAEQSISAMIKVIFSLPNLRRAAGPQGVLACIQTKKLETDNTLYISRQGTCSTWPGSFVLVYGDDK